MNKREAKRWVCGMAAALLISDLDMGEVVPEDDPDHDIKWKGFKELIAELQRREGNEGGARQPRPW